VVVLAVVGVVALITLRPGSDPVRVVDYSGALQQARAAAPYGVLGPQDLPGYRATSVRYGTTPDGATVWHLGFVTPAGAYAGVDQTDGDGEEFVAELTEAAEAVDGPPVDLGDRIWRRYDGGGDTPGELVRGLVNETSGVTTVVSGTAAWPELEMLARALR
jgi:hypothetical protein